MMGWVGSGEDFCGLGWVGLGPEILGWVVLGFEKVTHDQLWAERVCRVATRSVRRWFRYAGTPVAYRKFMAPRLKTE